jgi:carboxymethylenebutenolidase
MPKTHLPETQNWVEASAVNRRLVVAGGAGALAGYALAAGPVAASAIVTDIKGLDAGMVRFKTDGVMMNAYRAKPKGKRNAPVILVVQEIFGVHEWVKDMCRRYAKAGYYAIAPDLYQRQGDPTKIADFGKLFSEIVSKVPDAQVMADLDNAVIFAGSEGAAARRLGITGYCWGGRITWLYAAHSPLLKAGVACYGRLKGQASALQPLYPVDLAGKLRAPVLGQYGGKDKGIPIADVNAMKVALSAAKSRSTVTLYPDADHGFLADYRPSYDKAAADNAWSQGLNWFHKHL